MHFIKNSIMEVEEFATGDASPVSLGSKDDIKHTE